MSQLFVYKTRLFWYTEKGNACLLYTSYSSGTITATFMIGSVMIGSALRIASLKAIEPAMEKAISEESTS